LAIQLDVRDASAVENAINTTSDKFGGLDIVVNNVSSIAETKSHYVPLTHDVLALKASAINLTPTVNATVKSVSLRSHAGTTSTSDVVSHRSTIL
jgi:NAD(P)-dependent dehydrogenase (short-subunit alcohol dehydrogenase family)